MSANDPRSVEERLDALEIGLAVLKSRVTWGFAVLGILTASPKMGGPTFVEAVSFFL